MATPREWGALLLAVCGRGTISRVFTAGMSTHTHCELAAHMCACGHTVCTACQAHLTGISQGSCIVCQLNCSCCLSRCGRRRCAGRAATRTLSHPTCCLVGQRSLWTAPSLLAYSSMLCPAHAFFFVPAGCSTTASHPPSSSPSSSSALWQPSLLHR